MMLRLKSPSGLGRDPHSLPSTSDLLVLKVWMISGTSSSGEPGTAGNKAGACEGLGTLRNTPRAWRELAPAPMAVTAATSPRPPTCPEPRRLHSRPWLQRSVQAAGPRRHRADTARGGCPSPPGTAVRCRRRTRPRVTARSRAPVSEDRRALPGGGARPRGARRRGPCGRRPHRPCRGAGGTSFPGLRCPSSPRP